jgi:hypothetical protein
MPRCYARSAAGALRNSASAPARLRARRRYAHASAGARAKITPLLPLPLSFSPPPLLIRHYAITPLPIAADFAYAIFDFSFRHCR